MKRLKPITALSLLFFPFLAAAQAVIPLSPATVVTPGDDDDETVTTTAAVDETIDEVIAIDNFFDEEPLATELSAIATAGFDSIADPLADFPERLAAEKKRLQSPLEIDTSIDVTDKLLPDLFYLPFVFKPYDVKLQSPYASIESKPVEAPIVFGDELNWVNSLLNRHQDMEATIQDFAVKYPWIVKYNLENLPEAPKRYYAAVDPKTATIKVEEMKPDIKAATADIVPGQLKKKHWLHKFNGSIQFSQAYNSPNWYQGGNNNLNLIGNVVWNVKLNPAFHPTILFESTVQYKLAINSAPDDSLRNYSISEDLFQINTNFGLKASNNWYYSASMQFKTQLLNNYPTNSKSLKAAFLSPGELNVGVGMTYAKTYAKGGLNLSVNPLSYNMKMCLNSRVNETSIGIKEGHKTISQYGSNIEAKFNWKLAYNINYQTRLYAFTNYSYIQGDWEHTLSFDINRFLSTQIYIHLRYDSSTPRQADTKWHTWQLKEILSFGFSYKFSNI